MAKRKYESDQQAAERLASALQHLPDNWVMCRDMRHAWTVEEDFHVTVAGPRGGWQEIVRILVCMRCDTMRRERYAPSRFGGLDKVGSVYAYPEHYNLKGVPRGVKPQWLIRQEQYRRTLEKVAAASRTKTK